jgi:hypothetical protein
LMKLVWHCCRTERWTSKQIVGRQVWARNKGEPDLRRQRHKVSGISFQLLPGTHFQNWPVLTLSEGLSANRIAAFSPELCEILLYTMISPPTHAFPTYSNVALLTVVISLTSLTFPLLIGCNIA